LQEIAKSLNKLKMLLASPRLAFAIVALVALCQARATETAAPPFQVLISVPDQRLAVVKDGELVARFPVSTSRFGTGDQFRSYKTPLGQLRVYDKIGDGLAPGAVIRHRSPTGEVLPVNAPGRDPIVTRVIWLDGLEPQNKNALSRGIYIHGTPEERTIGTPVSWGCIRMRSKDVIKFFDSIPVGTVVSIIPDKLPHMHRYQPPKFAPPPPQAAPASSTKPPEPEKATPSVGPSRPSSQPENAPAPSARPSDITPASPLPAIGEGPQPANTAAWHAMKGSFLLANIPTSTKLEDHTHKTGQDTQ
jgi:lipoprotein-anchoring transpeptidase ErfK/SrfK